jgi:DNA (cytosine-5)-methyltransferase 1
MISIEGRPLGGFKFIDLFAGLGGFRLALESLGAKCVFSSEIDEHVAKVYEQNFGDKPAGDITKIEASDIPDHDILCGGFPCQPFSIAGQKKGFDDARGTLFFDIMRIVDAKKPRVVFLENVANLASHDNGKTFDVISNMLDEAGYHIFCGVLNASDYGIPQARKRYYIIAYYSHVRNKLCPLYLKHTKIFAYQPCIKPRCVEDILLDSASTSHLLIERKDVILREGAIDHVNADSTAKKVVRVGHVGKGGQGERIYSIRGQAITLTAYGGGVFSKTGGYFTKEGVRRLHPRECARLMGFPDDYTLDDNNARAYKQLGNSVVVDVIQHLGLSLAKVL